jgi:hypothetical protein
MGEWKYSSTILETLALDGREWSASRPWTLYPGENSPGTHWIGGWVGSREALDAVEYRKKNLLPFVRYRTSAVQPHYGPGVGSASNRNEYQESSWRGRRVKRALTAICEPIVETKYGSLDVSQSYRPPRPVTGIALYKYSPYTAKASLCVR